METENATRNWDSAGSLGGRADLVGWGAGVSRLAAHAGGELAMRGANRLTFVSHFVICLACAAMAFFAWQAGAVEAVWRSDASMMTSVIACLFVGTAVWLGRQAWAIDNYASGHPRYHTFMTVPPSTEWGHLAERLSVALGLIGTVIGLYMQAKLSPGEVNFTALITTGCGAISYAIIALLTFNLDAAVTKARR